MNTLVEGSGYPFRSSSHDRFGQVSLFGVETWPSVGRQETSVRSKISEATAETTDSKRDTLALRNNNKRHTQATRTMTTTPAHQSASPTRLHASHAASPQREICLGAAEIDAVKAMDDDAAMLDILDMDLDMTIPEVAIGMDILDASSAIGASSTSGEQLAPQSSNSSSNASANASAAAMKSQTCVTFLHIMKEFSESSCNATEMVQRVDSLVAQDEQLLKLLPLTKEDAAASSTTSDLRRSDNNNNKSQEQQVARTSVGADSTCIISMNKNKLCKNNNNSKAAHPEAMDIDDGTLGMDGRIASPRSVDLPRTGGTAAGVLPNASELLLLESDHESDHEQSLCGVKSPRRESDDDDPQARAAKRQRENDREMDAHDELQRWIDLDLELDHRMDVFDFTKDHAHANLASANATATLSTTSSSLPAQPSPFLRQASSSSFFSSSYNNNSSTSKSAIQAAGFLRGNASAVSRDMAAKRPSFAGSPWHKVTAAPFDKKSVTAALFGDDDGDDDDESNHSVIDTMARAKLLANASSGVARSAAAAAAALEREREGETKCDEENVWGMEDDEYQQDLLSSIDHSVLCDRENRFLQWDLEMEAQQQQQQMNTPPSSSSFGSFPSAAAGNAQNGGCDRSKYKWLMATSPREKIAKSPSNVDIVEDWNSLDFGTFQNRTVSHILSSCLNKRKLHHPYKNQVKLVNFNVAGEPVMEPVAPSSQHAAHALGGSLATSLAFGGQAEEGGMVLGGEMMMGPGMSNGSTSSGMLAGPFGVKDSNLSTDTLGKAGMVKGEKKSKKREERKRLMSLKMQETFADLEGTFTEQDLDFKNVAGAGSLSKMALAKLEAMPLPDLSNLPQDLKELKRKIEATEHKVEGTKHRHRKGGPCPRCQVQNQLRAAKRAYHKRAVAHKKLPQSAGAMALLESETADMMFSSPPLTPTASPSSVFDGASPSLSPVSNASSASPVSGAGAPRTTGAPFLPVVLPASAVSASAQAKPTVSTFASKPSTSSTPSLMVAVGSAAHPSGNNALLQHRQQSAAAQLVKNANRQLAAGLVHNNNNSLHSATTAANAARSTAAFQASTAPRRPCGNTSTASASTSPSSSDSASPQVHHVTVTSA